MFYIIPNNKIGTQPTSLGFVARVVGIFVLLGVGGGGGPGGRLLGGAVLVADFERLAHRAHDAHRLALRTEANFRQGQMREKRGKT